VEAAVGRIEWRAAAIWVAIYVAFQLLGRFIRLPQGTPLWVIVAVVLITTSLFMLLTIRMAAALALPLMERRIAWIALGIGLVCWLGIAAFLGTGLFSFGVRIPRNWHAVRVVLGLTADVARAVAAVGLGALVAGLIRERNILLPAAIFAAFADVMMVYSALGTVHKALQTEKGQKVVGAMSSHTPTVKAGAWASPALSVGMADIVFIGFFIACVVRFGMNLRGTIIAFSVLLTLALVSVAIFGLPVPALAPMALAFLITNYKHFQLSRSEKQAIGVAFALVALVTAGAFILMR
jgi:hypothetical protein